MLCSLGLYGLGVGGTGTNIDVYIIITHVEGIAVRVCVFEDTTANSSGKRPLQVRVRVTFAAEKDRTRREVKL